MRDSSPDVMKNVALMFGLRAVYDDKEFKSGEVMAILDDESIKSLTAEGKLRTAFAEYAPPNGWNATSIGKALGRLVDRSVAGYQIVKVSLDGIARYHIRPFEGGDGKAER